MCVHALTVQGATRKMHTFTRLHYLEKGKVKNHMQRKSRVQENSWPISIPEDWGKMGHLSTEVVLHD